MLKLLRNNIKYNFQEVVGRHTTASNTQHPPHRPHYCQYGHASANLSETFILKFFENIMTRRKFVIVACARGVDT